jgi:hypothetical protein
MMNESAYLDRVASIAGLRHYPRQGPWGRNSGSVIGARDGFVIIIGFDRNRNQTKVVVLLRFKKTDQPEIVKAGLAQSDVGISKKRGKLGAVGNDFLRWEWQYSFSKPKAEDVVQLSNSLCAAIRSIVEGFDTRCEKCQRTPTPELTLMNGLPLYICAGCQGSVQQENNQAAANYELIQPNYPNGLALGAGAAILGGIAWGLVAYGLNHIFLYGAILIGYFISRAMLKGTGKVTRFGQVCIPILTVGSILLGDALFYTLLVMKDQNLSFSLNLLGRVIAILWNLEREGNGALSVIFALVGAGYALYAARKPKFKAVFEPLGISAT